ncbi:MAG: YicC/YloC family endoribonuclease [Clostridia bacterium]
MVNSMTGFGRATACIDGREITFELKSVNHRYLDISYRMPKHIGFIEDAVRAELSDKLSRGHVDVYVNYRNMREDARKVEIDTTLLDEYISAARDANITLKLQDDMTLANALRMPDVTNVIENEEDRGAVCALARTAVSNAIAELKGMRAQEGKHLHDDLYERANMVKALAEKIALRAPVVVDEYKLKLNERIEKLIGSVEVDKARLATEVAIFADKASIDEEIVRLRSHVAQMRKELDSVEPAGRKLDFIVQEMNREFNTIGSKANDSAIVELVISGKAEIEKIREQVQNIE